jgi:hypothetical protein
MNSTVSLRCLGQLVLESNEGSSPRPIEPATQPIELLLRVAAAGPGGAPATMLCAAMWPDLAPPARHNALRAAMRRLDHRLGLHSVLVLDGNRLAVNGWTLGVDSIELEAAIAPLLNPFSIADDRERARAREALDGSAAQHANDFLPDVPQPWAIQARLRIADGVQRARQMLQTNE